VAPDAVPRTSPLTTPAAAEGVPAHRVRRPRLLLPLLVLSAAAAVCALAGADAARAAARLEAGRDALRTLPAGAREGGLARRAAEAARQLEAARRVAASSPWLRLLGRTGYLGRPGRWLREATAAAASLAGEAASAARRLDAALAAGAGPGQGRLALLDALDEELTRLARAARGVRLPDPGWTWPPARGAAARARAALGRARRAAEDGAAAARGLRSFLAGPTTALVLAGNNAEMRAGGMVLQAGLLRAREGRLGATGFASTTALALPSSVPLPEELSGLYGWLDPGREWRNTSTSPNFPAVAALYAAMAEARGLGRVDAVVYLDVVAVRHLLAAVGPVEAEGERYDAASVEASVLHDLYVRHASDRRARREALGALAAAVFRAVESRPVRPGALAGAIADAAAGRHVLLWSRREVERRAWRALGVDGRLERDGLMVSVQNHTGNKLDWFVRAQTRVTVERRPGGWRRVRLRLRIANPTPVGEPATVVGSGAVAPPGTYRAFVAFYLPGWAANVEVRPGPLLAVGPDGPMRVVATRIDVPLGEAREVEAVFSAPPGRDRVAILPSGRAAPVIYRLGGQRVGDDRRRLVRLTPLGLIRTSSD
jgi:hypothetical protein